MYLRNDGENTKRFMFAGVEITARMPQEFCMPSHA
jgi:hypothetical protein